MMKLSFLICAMFMMASCQPLTNQPSTDVQSTQDSSTQKNESEAQEIGKWRTESGYLYKYVIDGDTIFIMEGRNREYPVSIHIK